MSWVEPEEQYRCKATKKAGGRCRNFIWNYPPDLIEAHKRPGGDDYCIKHIKAAGPIRNSQQLKEGKPTCCLAFHKDIEKSVGTADMVRRCEKAGVPVKVVKE